MDLAKLNSAILSGAFDEPQQVPLELNRDLNVIIVDPNQTRGMELKNRLGQMPSIKMIGTRTNSFYLLDIFSEFIIDLIIFDSDVGWENILNAVREVRVAPAAENTGYMVISDSISHELVQKGAQAGVLGFLQKPFNDEMLEPAILEALGEPDANMTGVINKMKSIPFFATFRDRELLRLLNICPTSYLKAGRYVFKDGQPGDSLFVLVDGQVEIRKDIDGQDKVLNILTTGTCFGEMAIIDNSPRSANAVVTQDSLLFEINKDTLIEDDDRLALKLSRQISVELAHKIRNFKY